MANYVDGYVLPLPRKNIAAYRRLAQRTARIWRDHGALEYRECIGEDLAGGFGVPFPKRVKVKRGETVVFAWIVFKSRAHRDRVNEAVMKDPRLLSSMPPPDQLPFDCKRMLYGGFTVFVAA